MSTEELDQAYMAICTTARAYRRAMNERDAHTRRAGAYVRGGVPVWDGPMRFATRRVDRARKGMDRAQTALDKALRTHFGEDSEAIWTWYDAHPHPLSPC